MPQTNSCNLQALPFKCARPGCQRQFSNSQKLRQHRAKLPGCLTYFRNSQKEYRARSKSPDSDSCSDQHWEASQIVPRIKLPTEYDEYFDMGGNEQDEYVSQMPQERQRSHQRPPPDPELQSAFVERFPDAGRVIGNQETTFSFLYKERTAADIPLHYPFSCRTDVDVATFLHESRLPQSSIDKFLKLSYVRQVLLLWVELISCSIPGICSTLELLFIEKASIKY